jgi:cytochrome P450
MCRLTELPSASSSGSSCTGWFPTWRNHLFHSSVYAVVIAMCWRSSEVGKGSSSSSSNNNHATILHTAANCIIAGIAGYCLKSELSYMIQRRNLPPGDSGLPIVGHLPGLMDNAEAMTVKRIKKYGSICTFNIMMTPVVCVTDEEDVRWALMQERKGRSKALILPHFRKLLGEESIMVKSGEDHKRLRKIFEPAFTPMAIRDYAAAIDFEAQKKLAQWCDSGEFQEPREWALLAMRIFFVCAFGEADDERMKKLAYLFENWVDGFNAPIPMKIPGTLLARAHGFKDELGNVLKEMIHEFKEKNPPDSTAAKTSVLGRLCYAVDDDGNMPTETVLIDNLRFFLFAGFDTTKASFGGMSHYLKKHPKVEELLVKEVQNFKGDAAVLDVDQLKNEAPILNAIMAESWRLTAPLNSHSTVATEDLEYKGYFIPKGTFISIDIHAHAQMNNELYPEAEKFVFERWLPKDHPLYEPDKANTTEIDYNVMSSKFRTFNHGPHMCLGAHFAKLEVRIVLTRLFQSYKLEIRNETVTTFPTKQLLNEFKLTKL